MTSQITIMWSTIIGHRNQIGQLRRAVDSGNIPHAYLFSGIEGIGKRLVAYVVAGELLQMGGRADARLENNPDFIEIKPDDNQITIDLIRDLKGRLKFAPLLGERRVIIIDEADLMNVNAANAALKILEEPPPGNHFFLIATALDQMLPTIVSRCQHLQFSPLSQNQIEEYLIRNHKYPAEAARLAAEASGGSIGRALSADTDLIDSITQELFELFKKPSASRVLELSNSWAGRKDDIGKILYIIHQRLHEALLAGNDTERLAEKCNLINQMHAATLKTYNKQLMFEQLLFNLIS